MTMNPGDDEAIPGVFGDLMKVLGAQNSTSMWLDSARTLALGVASDHAPEGSPDPMVRIALEELADLVALQVHAVSDGELSNGQAPSLKVMSRSEFAAWTLERWTPRVSTLISAQTSTPLSSESLDGAVPKELEAFMGQMLQAMGPVLVGLQVGSACGHLAKEAFGPHDVPLPSGESNAILLVGPNVQQFSADWSIDPSAAQILALAREIIATRVFATQHVAARLEELLTAALIESAASQGNFLEQLQSSDEGVDLEAMLSNPESILERLSTPSQRWVSTQLSSLVAALEATVDRFTLAVAERMLGSSAPALEAYRRARASYGSGVEGACSLFGIDSSLEQTERGTRFVEGVLERSSLEQLLDLVRRPDGLPTPAEVDAPGLWLERLSLASGDSV